MKLLRLSARDCTERARRRGFTIIEVVVAMGLFLLGMIKHHEGALKMVDDLFETHGALQDDDLFKFASDIYADQTTEIDFMTKMLEGFKPGRQ